MPLYFNAWSHISIVYLFFLNGLMMSCLLAHYSGGYRLLQQEWEMKIVGSFFFSIALNGLIGLALIFMAQPLGAMGYILPPCTLLLLIWSVWSRSYQQLIKTIPYIRFALYIVLFVILFFNGGLIEKISDAWWHISYANKIGVENTIFLERGHLDGISSRYYPPLWHLNLAIAHLVSGEAIATLWNSFTAWGAVLKTMAFYLFAFGLSKRRDIGFVSALLFVWLPGVGDSYMRVSAWPSHIAYMGLFTLFFVYFKSLDKISISESRSFIQLCETLNQLRVELLVLVFFGYVILLSHKLELLWFAFAVLLYSISLVLYRSFVRDTKAAWQIDQVSWMIARLALAIGLIVVIRFLFFSWDSQSISIDKLLAYSISVVLLVFFNVLAWWRSSPSQLLVFVLPVLGIITFLSIDWRQLVSLFDPSVAYVQGRFHEVPLTALGWFGGDLKVPGWHLQLRGGFLWTGILSVPISIIAAILKPNRVTLFCAACGLSVFLFTASPYLYQWLRDIMDYHSPWRISVLMFHPIVFAFALLSLFSILKKKEIHKLIVPSGAFVLLLGTVIYDGMYHFDKPLMFAKIAAQSDQRNWSAHYGQNHVLYNSTMRYENDFKEIKTLVEPGAIVLSDLSTSYYAAGYLPVYVKNIHRHHGRNANIEWQKFLDLRHYCYIDNQESLVELKKFIESQRRIERSQGTAPFKYILLNNDSVNRNLKNDCIAFRHRAIDQNMEEVGAKLYQGEFLNLYQLY